MIMRRKMRRMLKNFRRKAIRALFNWTRGVSVEWAWVTCAFEVRV